MVLGTSGPAVVASVIDYVVEFYVKQAEAENHTVREAACYCFAELANKVDPTVVSPRVPAILTSLTMGLKDDSWPVRACVHALLLQCDMRSPCCIL